MIRYSDNRFYLYTKSSAYIIETDSDGYLYHLYYGRRITSEILKMHRYRMRGWSAQDINAGDREVPVNDVGWSPKTEQGISLDEAPQEYPSFGSLDLRHPAIEIEYSDGCRISDLRYQNYSISQGKKSPPGLPGVRGTGKEQTLELYLLDQVSGAAVRLYYAVFDDEDIICRWAEILNTSGAPFTIRQAFSFSMDIVSGGRNYDLVSFPGSWSREREFQRERIACGTKEIASSRGGSSHQMNPFVMLCAGDATEQYGEVIGSMPVYSGNHCTRVEKDQYDTIRFQAGISPDTFSWKLESGEQFCTPECIVCYSAEGFEKISQIMHRTIRDRILPEYWKNRPRPVLFNSWEAVYFDFDEDRLLSQADAARKIGVELFVLDDGWFGKRNNDRCSLGDWKVNRSKLPGGIKGLSDRIHAMGMQFGLWMEPEMVSLDSELYRAHPDWILHVPGRKPAITRHQYVLDLGKKEVREYVCKTVVQTIKEGRLDYIKWDMNRHMTDCCSMETYHRYMLGLYSVLERIREEQPQVLIESCAGGGGRYDAGMLCYTPQIWTSDNTDAIQRMKIQYGTSFGYPPCTMGAHVSAVPNHQTGRITSLSARIQTAMLGIYGLEMDLSACEEDMDELERSIELYKRIRHLLFEGDYYRLNDPFTESICSWMIVSSDRKEFCLYTGRAQSAPNPSLRLIFPRGLDPSAEYTDLNSGGQYRGDELMYYGLKVEYGACDGATIFWHMKCLD